MSTSDTQQTPLELKAFFQLLAEYAVGERSLSSLADALPTAKEDWPAELKYLWSEVGALDAHELATELVQRYSLAALLDRWSRSMHERLRDILVRRTFRIDRRDTLEKLGNRLGITRERVRQLEKQAISHMERLKQAEFAPVLRASSRLRYLLGSAIPEENWNVTTAVPEVLPGFEEIDDELSEFVSGLLVYLAGPYKAIEGWVVADKGLVSQSMDELMVYVDERGCIRDHGLAATLTSLDIRAEFHSQWIQHLRELKRVDGGYISLTGTLLEKARALLMYYERPMTAEEINRYLGSSSVKSVRQRLINDPVFWRINKQPQFVLAYTPGYDEYTGITDQIVQELEALGGRASVQHLVSKLSSAYGVKKNSVTTYLHTPMFTRDAEGFVRLRRDDESIEFDLNIEKVAGCYADGNDSWRWRIEVDSDRMRGSGRPMPNAFANLFGCGIDDKIEVQSNCGPVVLSWSSSSPVGALIGSIRRAILYLGANIGDFMFVSKSEHGMSFTCLSTHTLKSASSKLGLLLMLVGRHEVAEYSEMVSQLSSALRVSGTTNEERLAACRAKLLSKGEGSLARLIEVPEPSC